MDEALKVLVDKLAHKKFFMVLTLQYVCLKVETPDNWWYVPIVCATMTTVLAVLCQTYLDKNGKNCEVEE